MEVQTGKMFRPLRADWLQDAVIARAAELGLSAYAVWKLCDGNVSQNCVADYLHRRNSMQSNRLQHVLRAVRLQLAPESTQHSALSTQH